MTTPLLALAATALLVFARAIQQLNVIHGHYLAAALTPFLIAAGGGIGAVAAMFLHRRLRAAWATA
jgi:hypothetical protein